jgi:hypothetical protein
VLGQSREGSLLGTKDLFSLITITLEEDRQHLPAN